MVNTILDILIVYTMLVGFGVGLWGIAESASPLPANIKDDKKG